MNSRALLLLAAALVGCGADLGLDGDGEVRCEAPEDIQAGWSEPLPTSRLSASAAGDTRPARYLVYFQDPASPPEGPGPSPMMRMRRRDLSEADLSVVRRAGGEVALALPRRRAVAAVLDRRMLGEVRRDPRVRKVERDKPRYPLAQSTPWGLPAVNAEAAWQRAGGALSGTKVCVVDSGVLPHDDLPAVSGTPEGWGEDRCGHGTHVAGTLAALDNERGVVGLSPGGAEIYSVRVFDDDCRWTWASELSEAVEACLAADAKVVNMSLGGFGATEAEAKAFEEAWHDGALLVAAAGNAGGTSLQYPASYPSILSVGALDQGLEVAPFSQRNPAVDLAAPGVEITSTLPFVSTHLARVGAQSFHGGPIYNSAPSAGVEGPLVDGGLCEEAQDWSGAVVLCRRGSVTFARKLAAAEAGGAVAALVYNDQPGGFSGTVGDDPSELPAVSLTLDAGQALLTHLGEAVRVVNEPEHEGSGYGVMSGTSMAAPHVAGVAAFIWGQAPDRTNVQVRDALEETAWDLGSPGRDDASGHGLVQADLALERLYQSVPPEGAPWPGFVARCTGLACELLDTSVDPDGHIASRTFDFGDGATSGDPVSRHRYAAPGPWTVSLVVEDDQGREARLTLPVSVLTASGRGGPLSKDGSRQVALNWEGAAGDTVQVVAEGELYAETLNTGGVLLEVKDGTKAHAFRICDAGADSCSTEVLIAPPCT